MSNCDLVWNVYVYNINARKIEVRNVFSLSGLTCDVIDAFRKHQNKADFAKDVKSSLHYYFLYRAEWEVEVSGLFGKESTKIDVAQQVENNFEPFIEYVWQKLSLKGENA